MYICLTDIRQNEKIKVTLKQPYYEKANSFTYLCYH
jgi:hypothetical protein